MQTPSPFHLIRLLDPQTVADLLDASSRVPEADDPYLADLRRRLWHELFIANGEDVGQLRLPLEEVGDEPDWVTPCMSPPRSAIRDYSAWLRAGGGRRVNASCSPTCPCGGEGPPWAATAEESTEERGHGVG